MSRPQPQAEMSIGSLESSTPENTIPSNTPIQSSSTGSPSSGGCCLDQKVLGLLANGFSDKMHQGNDGNFDDVSIHGRINGLTEITAWYMV